jgi:hypothetical protein
MQNFIPTEVHLYKDMLDDRVRSRIGHSLNAWAIKDFARINSRKRSLINRKEIIYYSKDSRGSYDNKLDERTSESKSRFSPITVQRITHHYNSLF